MRREYYLYLAFVIALAATAGSLFFSEILKYPPCVLCWYQRITMYPLVVIFGVGIWRNRTDMDLYALPLAIGGLLISIYHNLLYYQLIPESNAPCLQGVSCTAKFIEWFGFITIPFLSFLAFAAIVAGLLAYRKNSPFIKS